jgi:hypothetical protein
MLYTKTNPTGIDKPIQEAQKMLHDRLNTLWSINLSGYGRAYILKRKDGNTVPEVFVSDNDYKDILGLDDSRFFFVQSPTSEKLDFKVYETDVDIYFIIDLSKVKSTITHRADEEVHQNVDYILSQTSFDVNSIEIGIDNFISDFSIEDMDNFKLADFQPYHIFKMACSVKYNLETTKCNI